MFEKAKSAKHVTIINFNKSFVQLRSETKTFQQNASPSYIQKREKEFGPWAVTKISGDEPATP